MPRKINRAITMTEARWRLQILRVDGSVEREQTFANEDTAFRAFDALAPSLPKRLQVRSPGRSRYVTLESEGCGIAKLADEIAGTLEELGEEQRRAREAESLAPGEEPASQRMHAFKAAPNWGDVCDVCGESENDPRHEVTP